MLAHSVMLLQNIKIIVSFIQGNRTALAPSHFPKSPRISFIRKYGIQAIELWLIQSCFTFQTGPAKVELDKGWPVSSSSEPAHFGSTWPPLPYVKEEHGLLGTLWLILVCTNALICWGRSHNHLLARYLA